MFFRRLPLSARVTGFREALRKKFEKTFGKIWKITEKVLTFAAVFRKGPAAGRGPLPKKNRKKTFEKIWKITEKVLTFAAAFPLNRGAGTRAIFDEFT